MALLIEDNAYLTVIDADAYFEDRLNTAVWDDTTPENKSASLIQATKAIETNKFLGARYDTAQKLSFPRSGIYIDNILIDATIVPQDVKDAVCEYAIVMLQVDHTAPDDLEDFSEVQVGPIQIKTNANKGGNTTPPMVVSLLGKYKDTSLRLVRT
jgi:hypothetical protein